MQSALQAAGFVGVECVDGVIYARTNPALPEFSATPKGALWQFSIFWPLRATDAQRAEWALRHPAAPLDVDLGETRMCFVGGPDDLSIWAGLVDDMVAACTKWRRATRQRDEGM
jgi:hypothetical protein